MGDAYLTQDQLSALGGDGDSLTEARERVNEWVTEELLYQEARRKGVADSEEMRERLNAVARRMAVADLLDQVFSADSAVVTDQAVASYYALHQEDFRLKEDVAQVSYLLFDDRDAANAFRSWVLRGKSWDEALLAAQSDSAVAPHVKGRTDRRYATRTTLFPGELWKVARTNRKETISFAISTNDGYYVLYLYELRQQGELADISYVSDEIRSRLMIEARRYQYTSLLRDLRSRFPIEIRLTGTSAASDTGRVAE